MKRMAVLLASIGLFLCSFTAQAADSPLPAGVNEITTPELKALFDRQEKFVLINSLSSLEFTQSKIAGAINIPYGRLRDGLAKLPEAKDAKLIFYCLGPG